MYNATGSTCPHCKLGILEPNTIGDLVTGVLFCERCGYKHEEYVPDPEDVDTYSELA